MLLFDVEANLNKKKLYRQDLRCKKSWSCLRSHQTRQQLHATRLQWTANARVGHHGAEDGGTHQVHTVSVAWQHPEPMSAQSSQLLTLHSR